jgi:hypothetical protein
MKGRLARLLLWTGWAGFLSAVSVAAGVFPTSGAPALLAKGLVFLDLPISAVSLALPFKGLWLFFVPPYHDRGIAPDFFQIFLRQLAIGVPTYLLIFWLASKLFRMMRPTSTSLQSAAT